ncbi:MAG: 3-hydroxyacyl-CoA dehydrogenase [Gemmobacter sp.]
MTIAGAGLIGRGWAAAFARAGWTVTLWDAAPDVLPGAEAAVRATLADMAAAGLAVRGDDLRPEPDLARALQHADYVQENIPEDRAAKAAVFALLDAHAPRPAVIGSSTSTFPGTWFLSDIPGRHRCMVAHPANPPHLMPVVELVPSPWHTAADVDPFVDILTAIGQVPVVLGREIEGFVMNRLQAAVVNEAVALVAQGVIDPEGLDRVMKHSLGLRWALMGPFETMDLNAPAGFLDYATRYGRLYQAMGRQLSVADDWDPAALDRIEAARRAAVPQGQVGERMEWRNRALMQLMALKAGLGA